MGGGGGGAVDADAVVAETVARAPPNGSEVESRRPALSFNRFGDGPPLGVVAFVVAFVVVVVVVFVAAPLHYGTKPGHFETSKINFPTSEGVSEVSERASE